MKEITVPALIEKVADVTAFIDAYLEEIECPIKAMMQIDIAIDEIFSNIVFYAYSDTNIDDSNKNVTVKINKLNTNSGVAITFIDKGKHYNPLEKEDPDTHLSAQERGIGGLGVFIVKKTMDNTDYDSWIAALRGNLRQIIMENR